MERGTVIRSELGGWKEGQESDGRQLVFIMCIGARSLRYANDGVFLLAPEFPAAVRNGSSISAIDCELVKTAPYNLAISIYIFVV